MGKANRRVQASVVGGAVWGGVVLIAVPQLAAATEGGVGRPITGQQAMPYGGIVPPTSDWIASFSTIYYQGSIGASKVLPVAGRVTAGLNEQVVYNIANLVRTWGITAGGWNFASSFGVPVQYTNASSFNGLLRDDHGIQFADIFFSPVVAGYHFSKTDHVALSVQIYAPTGAYSSGRLANAGQNTWTFTPTIAFTHLIPSQGIELTLNYGLEFYTANDKTQYHNAPVSVLDLLALKRFTNGWGVGVVGGYIQQISEDSGGIADVTGGAKGHSVGIGPMVTWSGKISKTPVSAALRWVNEFEASRRPKGNAVQLSISATFE
ncbi:transporter [Paraburkholderia sp.]|uniref:SphA family protein n=1 Tax=Paraburkholderia sp. TaxID=1926495 RepID=UPI0023A02574|nr:transporter [Paraburkholderia sp.]MDE1179003.1 transporter [Paraburkholderia sp.]